MHRFVNHDHAGMVQFHCHNMRGSITRLSAMQRWQRLATRLLQRQHLRRVRRVAKTCEVRVQLHRGGAGVWIKARDSEWVR
jgi:hypothetical protein